MIRLNIGSEEEFTELQTALERSLRCELDLLDESDQPGARTIADEHAASIKIIKILLSRLIDLEKRATFGKKSRKNEEDEE